MKTSIIHAARRSPPGREAGFISFHSAIMLLGLISVFGIFILLSFNDCEETKRKSPLSAQSLNCSVFPIRELPDRLTEFYLYAGSHLKRGETLHFWNFLKAIGGGLALSFFAAKAGRKIKPE